MKLKVSEVLRAAPGSLLQGPAQAVLSGVSIDSRRTSPGELFVPLTGNNCDGHLFIRDAFNNGAQASFVRQGHPLLGQLLACGTDKALIAVADPLQALGEVARWWRKQFQIPVVAITGSNGKTTTKEMLWQITSIRLAALKNPGNWNNLIGLPLSLLQLHEGHQVGIMEMGMSERGEIQRLAEISAPHIAVITNIGPAHLEQLKTIDNIMAAKGELFAALGAADIAVVNRDDERVMVLAQKTRARILSFGTREGDIRGELVQIYDSGETVFNLDIMGKQDVVTLAPPGGIFLSNALAAAAVAHALNMRMEEIKQGLEAFRPIPGRMEIIRVDGITIINDSYNANPISMEASLKLLSAAKQKHRTIAVLGDMLELGEQSPGYHREVGRATARCGIDFLFVYGQFSASVAEGARADGMSAQHVFTFDKQEVLREKLRDEVHEGDWVLVKGSRAMKMEQIVEFLQRKAEAG